MKIFPLHLSNYGVICKGRVVVVNFFKNKRVIFTLLFILLALCAIFLPQIIIKLSWYDEELIGFELVAICAEITSSLFVIVGTVIAVWQYYLSSSQKIKEFQFAKIKRAIELSEYYKDNILARYSYVKKIFDDCVITKIIEHKRNEFELKHFDIQELKSIYTTEELQKIKDLTKSEEFVKAIAEINCSCNLDLHGCEKIVDDSGHFTGTVNINPKEITHDFFKKYITDTLNNAEYFAMAFTHNIADESVIFQSIYPTYLEMCFIMYFYIAIHSDPNVAKLYTNIAELYCIWRKKEQKQKEKMASASRNNGKDLGNMAD